jgi:hypothetical protein
MINIKLRFETEPPGETMFFLDGSVYFGHVGLQIWSIKRKV